jgi:hypothetical protein
MPCDKGVFKKEKNERDPWSVPSTKEVPQMCQKKKIVPKNLQINSLKCAQTKNALEKIQKESL